MNALISWIAILRDAVIAELEALRTMYPVYRGFWCVEVLL